jgi:hypothetical protein
MKAALAIAVRLPEPLTTTRLRLAMVHWLCQSTVDRDGEPDVKLNGELHHDHHPSLWSMSFLRQSAANQFIPEER